MSVEDTDFEYFEDDGDALESFEADARVAQTSEALGATGARAERDDSADPAGSSGGNAAEETFDSDGGAQSDPDEEELYEIEFSDDDVVAYLEDEEGNEIGVVMLEDGEEVEYYYAEEEGVEYVSADDTAPAARKSSSEPGKYDFGITKEGIAETTDDLNAVFREGAAMGSELKDAFVDITEGFKDITGTTRPARGRKK